MWCKFGQKNNPNSSTYAQKLGNILCFFFFNMFAFDSFQSFSLGFSYLVSTRDKIHCLEMKTLLAGACNHLSLRQTPSFFFNHLEKKTRRQNMKRLNKILENYAKTMFKQNAHHSTWLISMWSHPAYNAEWRIPVSFNSTKVFRNGLFLLVSSSIIFIFVFVSRNCLQSVTVCQST